MTKGRDALFAVDLDQFPGEVQPAYQLKLFVAGMSRQSIDAIAAVKTLCETFLCDAYALQIIDIYQHPQQAEQEQIIVVPTLLRYFPEPKRRMSGDLSDYQRVLKGLDLKQTTS